MECPECGGDRRYFAVPPKIRSDLPNEPASVLLCTRCLAFESVTDPDTELSNFATISDALPDQGESAAAMVLATALLSSLALYRQHVDALFDHVEAAGVDPLLVLDRLADDPDIHPDFDIESRRQQLLQLRD